MSTQNRLQLNFQLESRQERVEFANKYIQNVPFTLSSEELETISNYILWGKNEKGENGRQEGLQLETRHKTWDAQQDESLDALVESPTFNEASLLNPIVQKKAHTKLSRTHIRQTSTPATLEVFEGLWTRIDEAEFLVATYDILKGKRTKPIREELLRRISPERQQALRTKAESLGNYEYLKWKYQLVELRREQYTLKDTIAEPLQLNGKFWYNAPARIPSFEDGWDILPMGLPSNSTLAAKIWNGANWPHPAQFTPNDLEVITKLLWEKRKKDRRYFDFGNVEHLYALFGMWEEMEEAAARPQGIMDSTRAFMRALDTYRKLAHLDSILEKILEMKARKASNQLIADEVNKEFGKNYKPNYISTLYCKKCLEAIAQAARDHREVMENIFFEENFKKCKDCGKVLLATPQNYMRRARSKDGLSPRCKECERVLRNKGKEGK